MKSPKTFVGDNSRSLRSRRKSLAQGKRSETKLSEAQPWVTLKSLARFRGRQKTNPEASRLSPAKAGSLIQSASPPRVPLASLASPWAKLRRLLRRLLAAFDFP